MNSSDTDNAMNKLDHHDNGDDGLQKPDDPVVDDPGPDDHAAQLPAQVAVNPQNVDDNVTTDSDDANDPANQDAQPQPQPGAQRQHVNPHTGAYRQELWIRPISGLQVVHLYMMKTHQLEKYLKKCLQARCNFFIIWRKIIIIL